MEVRERLKKEHDARMNPIYAEFDKMRIPRFHADAFYYRICQFPIKQTLCIVELLEKGDMSVPDVGDKLHIWKEYLNIMLKTHPNHEKAGEWKESLAILEQKNL